MSNDRIRSNKNSKFLFRSPSADFEQGSYKQTPLSTSDLHSQTLSHTHLGALKLPGSRGCVLCPEGLAILQLLHQNPWAERGRCIKSGKKASGRETT